jgi:hypothetical protein
MIIRPKNHDRKNVFHAHESVHDFRVVALIKFRFLLHSKTTLVYSRTTSFSIIAFTLKICTKTMTAMISCATAGHNVNTPTHSSARSAIMKSRGSLIVTDDTESDGSSVTLATWKDFENDGSHTDFQELSDSAASPVEGVDLPLRQETADDSSSNPTHGVRFSTITIREYPMSMGDNPSVSSGIPVTIDWKHERETVCDVSEYEEGRHQRRAKFELLLPESLRLNIVRERGFSRGEIQEQRKEVNVCRGRRRRTVETLQLYKLQESLEVTWRATLNATIRQGRKRMEREYISQARSTKEALLAA